MNGSGPLLPGSDGERPSAAPLFCPRISRGGPPRDGGIFGGTDRTAAPRLCRARLTGALLAGALLLVPGGGHAQGAGAAGASPADLLLVGGRIHTVDAARPRAEAVAVRGDRIVFVGSEAEARILIGPQTRVVELDGRAVIPGFIDSHGHVPGLADALLIVDLVGTRSYEEVIARVSSRASDTPAGGWIRGRGWDQNHWPDTRFPTHHALSRAVPDHPVALTRVDGHALLVNEAALAAAGITAATPDPAGGRIERDPATGEATGVLVDAAMSLVRATIPPTSREEMEQGLALAQQELHRLGITMVHDAGIPLSTLALYEEMADRDLLSLRIYAMISGGDDGLAGYLAGGPRVNIDGRHRLTARAIKVSIDGALGSRGAALLEGYSDEPENTGLLLVTPERLREIVRGSLRSGIQLNVHAIGDRGNRIVLDLYDEELAEHPRVDHRFRIEHAQILHRFDIPRFAELGVIPSMQAIHQASDMPWAEVRLGWTRLLGSYAWRSLLDTGVIIAGGSDFPVESPDPLLSFHAAVTRQNGENWPAGGWFPAQRMTRDEALRHMTLWGSYASFQENEVGSVTPGKLADLVVLSQDIMSVPAEEILDAVVDLTVVGGTVVFERLPGPPAPR